MDARKQPALTTSKKSGMARVQNDRRRRVSSAYQRPKKLNSGVIEDRHGNAGNLIDTQSSSIFLLNRLKGLNSMVDPLVPDRDYGDLLDQVGN